MAQAGRADAVTIATYMAGRGTDVILSGNTDYMAQLKLREVLLPQLVRPEESHKPPIPLQSSREGGGGFSPDANQSEFSPDSAFKVPSEARAIGALTPQQRLQRLLIAE